jgi:sulfur carrier protein
MKVWINAVEIELAVDQAGRPTLENAIAVAQATPPFAVAVNLQFVPKTQYAKTPIKAGDRIDIIAPITGG